MSASANSETYDPEVGIECPKCGGSLRWKTNTTTKYQRCGLTHHQLKCADCGHIEKEEVD